MCVRACRTNQSAASVGSPQVPWMKDEGFSSQWATSSGTTLLDVNSGWMGRLGPSFDSSYPEPSQV